MERRFAVRYEQLMAEAEVKPESFEGVLKRLDEFVGLFTASLKHDAQRQHATEYVTGLVSNVKRKNIETIAYLHEQDRQPLQKFIGQKPWEWTPMIGELARQIGESIGRADGVLVIDPSGVLKQGKASVGVARQWCGRAGKVDNCQVGVYLGYVSREEHAIKHDYALSNAPFETPLREFARVLNAEHRIEECLRRAKSESGLAEYQVRTWRGWHHHQTLTLIATWFLTQEKRRGEKGVAVSFGSRGVIHDRSTAA